MWLSPPIIQSLHGIGLDSKVLQNGHLILISSLYLLEEVFVVFVGKAGIVFLYL